MYGEKHKTCSATEDRGGAVARVVRHGDGDDGDEKDIGCAAVGFMVTS